MLQKLFKSTPLRRAVYIVDGMRTPWLKVRGEPGKFSASDLAVQASRCLLARQSFTPEQLNELVTGCVMPGPDESNISRLIALRLGCGSSVPAYTVQRNCGSGLQALDNASLDIAAGRCDLVLAGGTEAMSHSPLLLSEAMTRFLARWRTAKTPLTRFRSLAQLRWQHLKPIIALSRGLTDPIVNLSMGQTAEIIANRFAITRQQMDAWAWQSHQRLALAQDKGFLQTEISPLYDNQGCYYAEDNGLRRTSDTKQLAGLKPFFDQPFGLITAGNSSQLTDGAAFLVLASEQAVKRYQLASLARIVAVNWAALDPAEMGLGPVHAVAGLLKQLAIAFSSIDYWEINEAFAGQVLACLAAWQDIEYCKTQLALTHPLGKLDESRVNIDGGAIALGHPVGASGARIVLHLAHVLKRKKARLGVATLCVGGGQGGAVLLENTNL